MNDPNTSTSNPSPTGPGDDPNNKSTSRGFLTLILVSVGVLLAAWGLMTVLDWAMG